jgi:hypothetical protein
MACPIKDKKNNKKLDFDKQSNFFLHSQAISPSLKPERIISRYYLAGRLLLHCPRAGSFLNDNRDVDEVLEKIQKHSETIPPRAL